MATVTYTVFNGEVLSENRNGVERDYVPDPSGNVVALLDSSQNITDTFQYWSYGELMSRTGSTPINLKFGGALGYFTDADGSIYVRRRRLDPKNGRWQTVDPIWPSQSAYIYARSSPSTFSDPTGLQSGDSARDKMNELFPPGYGIPPWLLPPSINPLPSCKVPTPWPPSNVWGSGIWGYGTCCGPAPSKRCSEDSIPIDCVDAACKAHDNCVGSSWIWGPINWLPCNKKFCNDIKFCWNKYCTGPKIDIKQCSAIKDIAGAFCNSFGGGPPNLGNIWK